MTTHTNLAPALAGASAGGMPVPMQVPPPAGAVQADRQAARGPRPAALDLHDFGLDGWLVQPSLDRVTRDGVAIRIRPQLMDVLVCLAAHPGSMVTREELLATVWSDRFVVESSLTRCVAELRQVLGDSARQPRIIETIPKRGYRLIADVICAREPDQAVERVRVERSSSSLHDWPPEPGRTPSRFEQVISRLRAGALAFGARLRRRQPARSLVRGRAVPAVPGGARAEAASGGGRAL